MATAGRGGTGAKRVRGRGGLGALRYPACPARPEVSAQRRRGLLAPVPSRSRPRLRPGPAAAMKDVPGFLQQSQSAGPGQAAVWHRLEELYNKK